MADENDPVALDAPMKKLADMGLDDKVLRVFQEAERRMLAARGADDVVGATNLIRAYVLGQRKGLLNSGYLSDADLDAQFGEGVLYIGRIALTGVVP